MIILGLVRFALSVRSHRKTNFPGTTRSGLAAWLPPGNFPARAVHPCEVAHVPEESESSKVVTARGVYDDGVLRITATANPPGLAIAGEIDENTYPALVAQLEGLAGAVEIHLNLAGVEFCDVAGLRAMIRLAGVGRGGDSRQVVLHEVPPQLKTVLGILGWDSTPGLVIDQSGG